MIKPVSERRQMIESGKKLLSKTKLCNLLGIHRSGLYYKPVGEKPREHKADAYDG